MIAIVPRGKVLRGKAVTARTGWVKVEVVGSQGRGLADCAPVVGDQDWARVKWKGSADLGLKEGQPVTLRLELKQAKMFGLEFE
jgi:hypothetical protein